jgi:hypothetical protein
MTRYVNSRLLERLKNIAALSPATMFFSKLSVALDAAYGGGVVKETYD